jgi:hypothetical protein
MEKFIFMPVYYMFAMLAVYQLVKTYRNIFLYAQRKVKRLNSLKAAKLA